MRVLTAEAMQAVDRRAIEELGVPSLVLMENAALGVVEAIGERFAAASSVAVFCGPGNNGGDGLAIARQLATRGYRPRIFLATGGRELRGDAARQLAICRRLELPLDEIGDRDLAAALAAAGESDLVVDALFGTGLSRPLEGFFAALVEGLDALPVARLAVDLPSGLGGSQGELLGPHLSADLTVAFAALKVAHVLPPAAEASGELAIADLGVPPWLVDEADGDLWRTEAGEVAALLPGRSAGGHKGDFGHVLVVAGSPGKAGAAVLAARAAVRSGAGLVTAAVPRPLATLVDGASIESMTLALAAGDDGELAAAAVDEVLAAAAERDVLALGPGLGQGEETRAAIRDIVLGSLLPMVLDADGINAFAGRAGELSERGAPTVLTPHPGEMGRLLGTSGREVQSDRLAAVRRAASETGAVVVLKGHCSLVAGAGRVSINPTGNPGMATGGTGDVLTGMIAGLLGQGLEAEEAARAAVYLHGLAGDLAAAEHGEIALAAGDLLAALPAAFGELERERP